MNKANTSVSQPPPDDPPPPYTDTTSDAMEHYETTHHTLDSSTAGESSQQPRNLPTYHTQPQSTSSQRFNLENIPQRFRYQPNRGLIGNALGLASAVVGTATDIVFGSSEQDDSSSRGTSHQEGNPSRRRYRRGLVRSGFDYIATKATEHYATTGSVVLVMVQKNSPIQIQEFMGDECRLETTNAHIQVLGSLSARRKINMKTTNGNIVVNGQISAGKSISVNAGSFIVNGNSIVAKKIDINLDNGPLNLTSFIESNVIQLKTNNAPVILSHIAVGSELSVKTSNAVIELHIEDIGTDNAIINVETANAPANVYLPRNFAGRFFIKTSSPNQANVAAKSAEIQYNVEEQHQKEGVCTYMEKTSNTEIHVNTTNAPVTLYI